MEKMFKASRKIKIDDANSVLKLPRPDLLEWVFDLSSRMGVMVDCEYLVVGEDVNLANLEKEFTE